MRSDGPPLTFAARARRDAEPPTFCISPCHTELGAGDYELSLNGVRAETLLRLRESGTLHGEYRSRAAARAGGWLALNVGGIIGGVFLTVGALGGPGWAYAAGGGALAAGGAVFLISYRADRASFDFTPDAPADARGMPEAMPSSRARQESLGPARSQAGMALPGLGLRLEF